MEEDEKLINKYVLKYDLKWEYEETNCGKFFTVNKCTSFIHSVAKFAISKKKKKITYTLKYCGISEYFDDAIKLVEEFIDKYSDMITEDQKK